MKMRKPSNAMLALAAVACLTTSAMAASYTNGQLLLGFRATAGTGLGTDYVVNLGTPFQFRDAASSASFNLSLGDIGADLSTIYGGAWYNRSDVKWSLIGGSAAATSTGLLTDPTNTLYVSNAETTVGTLSVSNQTRRSNSAQAATVANVNNAGSAFAMFANTASTNATNAIIETEATSKWSNNSAIGFGAYSLMEGDFGAGAAGTALDIFRYVKTTAVNNNDTTVFESTPAGSAPSYEGTLHIDQAGVVSYTGSVTAVPEASTYASWAVFGLFLTAYVARKSNIKSANLA